MPREFESQEKFEEWVDAWCDKQSIEVNCTFAARNAAFVLPNIFGGRPEDLTGYSFDLILLRATLIPLVRGVYTTNGIKFSARSAALSARSARSAAAARSARSAAAAALSARSAADSAAARSARSAARSATLSAARSATLSAAARSAHSASFDLAASLEAFGISGISTRPLWGTIERPDAIKANWEGLRAEWQSDPSMTFWVDWYDGLLTSRVPDWELWHEIALIEDQFWEDGPKAVAEEIEKIKNARSLEGKIEALEAELLRLASEPIFEGNAHNGGPPLEDHSRRLETIQLIRAQLDILKEEVAKRHSEDETPDPEIIESVVTKIVALIKKHFIIAGAAAFFATGVATKITEDAIDHYRVSETIFQTVDDVAEAATRYIQSLRTSSSKGRNDYHP
ncbi:hypothetical protein [Celeribacter sp. SCSIO 80788]|uniref:hypothetical protein n=1 Tax=Celeribacter sp. SCSIO 80788 TaxID=3117013 RepID=UPI003DA2CD08